VNMTMPDAYAHALFVEGGWSVGMKGWVRRRIKVSGNMKKLIPLQLYKPSPQKVALRQEIARITQFEGGKPQ